MYKNLLLCSHIYTYICISHMHMYMHVWHMYVYSRHTCIVRTCNIFRCFFFYYRYIFFHFIFSQYRLLQRSSIFAVIYSALFLVARPNILYAWLYRNSNLNFYSEFILEYANKNSTRKENFFFLFRLKFSHAIRLYWILWSWLSPRL